MWLTGQWQHRKLIGVNHAILVRLYLKQLMALWNVDRLGIMTNKKYLVNARRNEVTECYQIYRNFFTYLCIIGAHSGVVVKALCYKLAGRGFDS